MKYKKFLGAARAPLMIVIAAILMLAHGASAQSKFKTLHRFTGGTDGGNPRASVVLDQAGNLYGTAENYGAYGYGVVFKVTPNADGSWTESVLHSFDNGDGMAVVSGLIFDADGNLNGTAADGGSAGAGMVFQLTPNADGSWSENILYTFTGGKDGGYPAAGLTLDQAGNLYGMTEGGGAYGRGTVFELTPNPHGSWTEKVLYSFTGGKDGWQPLFGSLVFDGTGNLYGTVTEGGAHTNWGVVFKLTPNPDGSWTESVLHNFTGGWDGGSPYAGVIVDRTGNLYGTTEEGGNSGCANGLGCGVVFQLILDTDGSWKEKVLHRFSGGKDGASPWAGLIFDQAGNLYGTTLGGGNLSCDLGYGCGVVFKLAPNSNGGWNETVLHAFINHPGAGPMGGLIFDAARNLYGTTAGAVATEGSVFEITP